MPDEIQGPTVPDDESLAFEIAVVLLVTGQLSGALDALTKSILEVFERFRAQGSISVMQALSIGAGIAASVNALTWTAMLPKLQKAAEDARDLGQVRAVRRFTDQEERDRAAAWSNWRATGLPEVPDIDRAAMEGVTEAARIARAGVRTRRDVSAVAGKLRSTRARVEGTARYVANEGINAGTAEVARAMDLRLLWVAERNACLHCLAHAGYAVNVGATFPGGLSFDPNGSKLRAVEYPPLHPNCRCQVRTYEGEAGPPTGNRSSLDPADRLAAEARRSVVYQWTDHASGPAARRAAESLLSAGAGLPSSVEQRARAMLKRRRT